MTQDAKGIDVRIDRIVVHTSEPVSGDTLLTSFRVALAERLAANPPDQPIRGIERARVEISQEVTADGNLGTALAEAVYREISK